MTVFTSGIVQDNSEHVVPLTVDIVTAAAALASATEAPQADEQPTPYILYEKADEITFAAGCAIEIRLDRNGLHLIAPTGSRTEPLGDRPFEQLDSMLAGILPTHGASDLRFFGWAAFELSYLLQGLPIADDAGTLLYLFVPQHIAQIRSGEAKLNISDPEVAERWHGALQNARARLLPERVHVDEIEDTTGYVDAARDAIQAIDGRKLRKLILSRSVFVQQEIDLIASYQTLRRNNTPARSFLLRLGGIAAAGVSPGAIVEVSSGAVVAQPLAGTRAYTNQPERDAALREDLLSDPKEIYEHALSVKLAQDEIADVSEPGTVFVENFMDVVSRGSVQHLASHVRGQLRSGASHVLQHQAPLSSACRCEARLYRHICRALYRGFGKSRHDSEQAWNAARFKVALW